MKKKKYDPKKWMECSNPPNKSMDVWVLNTNGQIIAGKYVIYEDEPEIIANWIKLDKIQYISDLWLWAIRLENQYPPNFPKKQ